MGECHERVRRRDAIAREVHRQLPQVLSHVLDALDHQDDGGEEQRESEQDAERGRPPVAIETESQLLPGGRVGRQGWVRLSVNLPGRL